MSQRSRRNKLMTTVGLALILAPVQPAAAPDLVQRLCQETNCQTVFYFFPKIERVFIFSNITPGGYVILGGRGFGSKWGSLTLKFVDFQGKAKSVQVLPTEWGNTFVGGKIPAIAGVLDQQATLQVQTASRQFSNEFSVTFKAERDMRLLPPGDPATRVISCGFDSNFDICFGSSRVKDPDDEDLTSGGGPSLSTIAAGHYNRWGTVGNDYDSDIYEVTLKNGWVLDAMDWHVIVDWSEAAATKPAFPSGATHWKPTIKWIATPNDGVAYTINVHINGPKGTPWR